MNTSEIGAKALLGSAMPGYGALSNTVRLRGLEFFAYHGVMPEERVLGQKFVVDVDLALSQNGVFLKDDLQLTVDYALVYEKIAAVMTRAYQTLEYLAEQIARDLLTEFACSAARVAVHKPGAPVRGIVGDVVVDIVRPNVWQAFLGLGSNMGDRAAHLSAALDLLKTLGIFRTLSHVYETEPLGTEGEQLLFYNMVVEMETALPPMALLEECLRIEALCGRRRRCGHEDSLLRGTSAKEPRTLDIDLLLLFRGPGRKRVEVRVPDLIVPHPRLELREFVLAPLREIAPHVVLPSGDEACQVTGEGVAVCLGEPSFSVENFWKGV